MWSAIITVGLQVVGWFLTKNQDNKGMQQLFYKFVENIQSMYLKSAHMHTDAKALKKAMDEKLAKEGFQETP